LYTMISIAVINDMYIVALSAFSVLTGMCSKFSSCRRKVTKEKATFIHLADVFYWYS